MYLNIAIKKQRNLKKLHARRISLKVAAKEQHLEILNLFLIVMNLGCMYYSLYQLGVKSAMGA